MCNISVAHRRRLLNHKYPKLYPNLGYLCIDFSEYCSRILYLKSPQFQKQAISRSRKTDKIKLSTKDLGKKTYFADFPAWE